jgi:apolipoprotein D and lipocalin family protein
LILRKRVGVLNTVEDKKYTGDSMRKILGLFISLLLLGCAGVPKNVTPVQGFDVNRYLGTWYEIARLDNSFERGLEKVTADYTLMNDGGIQVVNRGFDPKNKLWKESVGRAYFVRGPHMGILKVSFFRPFYGGYNIIALDELNYTYAMVCGPDRSYLWILARQPGMDVSILSELVRKAEAMGFETKKMIFTNQGK